MYSIVKNLITTRKFWPEFWNNSVVSCFFWARKVDICHQTKESSEFSKNSILSKKAVDHGFFRNSKTVAIRIMVWKAADFNNKPTSLFKMMANLCSVQERCANIPSSYFVCRFFLWWTKKKKPSVLCMWCEAKKRKGKSLFIAIGLDKMHTVFSRPLKRQLFEHVDNAHYILSTHRMLRYALTLKISTIKEISVVRTNYSSHTLSFVLDCSFKITIYTGTKLTLKLHFFSLSKQINPEIQLPI